MLGERLDDLFRLNCLLEPASLISKRKRVVRTRTGEMLRIAHPHPTTHLGECPAEPQGLNDLVGLRRATHQFEPAVRVSALAVVEPRVIGCDAAGPEVHLLNGAT